MLPLIISLETIVGIIGPYVGASWRRVLIFLTQLKSVINRNIISIAFAILLQAETVCVNADQFRKFYTPDVY